MELNGNKQIAKGAALLGISAIIVKIIGVIYKVPLSYILGDEGMGYFNSAYTVYTLFFLLSSAGVPKAISIIISKNEAESKNNSYSIMRVLAIFFVISGVIISLLFSLFASSISEFIGNRGALYTMYAVAPSIPLLCLCGVLRGYLIGKMNFLPIAISEIISGASKLIFGLVFAIYSKNRGMSLEIISAYTILGITLGAFLSLLPLLASAHRKKQEINTISLRKTIIDALKITIPITISSALSGIAGIIDLTLIMRGLVSTGYSETVATVIYGNYTTLAVPMFTLVATLIAQIATSLLPILSRNSGTENNDYVNFAMLLSFFVAFPCALYFYAYPTDVLGILFEKSSVALGSSFLASVAPSILLLAPLTIINTVLESKGKILIPVFSLAIGSIIKLIASGVMIVGLDLGVLAASFGTFLSYLIPLIISYVYLSKTTKCRVNLSKCIIIPLISSTMSVACGLFLRSIFQNVGNERLKSILFLLSVGVIYLILSAILSKKHLKNMHNYVKINKIKL